MKASKLHLSIRWKLILALLLPIILVTTLVMGVTLTRIYQYAAENIQERSLRELNLYASRIGVEFEAVAQVARSAAAFISLQEGISEDGIYDVLASNVMQHELIYGSALAFEPFAFNPDVRLFSPYVFGEVDNLQAIDIGADSYDYSDGSWDWYSAVYEQQRPLWTDAYFDEGAGNVLMTTFSVPVLRNGQFIGVTTIDVHLDQLQKEAQQELAGQNFAIVDPTGAILASNNPDVIMSSSIQEQAALVNNPDFQRIVSDILAGNSGSGEVENFVINGELIEGTSWIFYTPIPSTGWYLVTVIPEIVSTAVVRSSLNLGILGLIAMIVLGSGFVWAVSTRMTRPIKVMAEAVSDVARGKLDTHIENIRSMDELGRLSMGFNRMVKNLKKHVERESKEAAARQMVEEELLVARQTQEALLPREFPPFPDRKEFELHAENLAARHVAGDFFDYFLISPKNLMFVIADVSGKGVAAALVMAVTRTIIRNLGKSGKTPAEILAETNTLLIESQKKSAFVTIFLGIYNTASGRIIYANAGHSPPFIIAKNGAVTECGAATGTIIGMLENETIRNDELRLQQGETLLLYTDGFSEARSPSGEFYGPGRIKHFLEAHGSDSPKELCDSAMKEICQFQNENLADDITILALKRTQTRISMFFNELIGTK